MEIAEAAETIKSLYRNNNGSTDEWEEATGNFSQALENTGSHEPLEACILADSNWELSVDERLALLERAKLLGADSNTFLKDYYGYRSAHLDPGEEKTQAKAQLQKLLDAS